VRWMAPEVIRSSCSPREVTYWAFGV
nr:tyrosine kinase {catalytic domain, clone Xltk29, subdomain VIII} [Xenopus laevis, Peptide Partial, 25 aa] [Xenopus laevis]